MSRISHERETLSFPRVIASISPENAYTSPAFQHAGDQYVQASATLYVRRGRVRMEVLGAGMAHPAGETTADGFLELVAEGLSVAPGPVSLFIHAASADCDADLLGVSLAPMVSQ